MCLSVPQHSAHASLTDGLVGHWTFDGKDTTWTSATMGTTNNVAPSNFPTIVSSVTFTDETYDTTQTITLPSGIVTGNLLVVVLRNGATITNVSNSNTLATSSAGGHYSGVYYRIADGSEGATVTFTGGWNSNMSGIAYQIPGFSEIEASYATTNTVDPPTLTPSWGQANTMWIAFIDGARGDWVINSTPTNYTNSLIGKSGNGSTESMTVSTASRNLNASSDNPSTFVAGATSPVTPRSGLIAIAPAISLPRGRLSTWTER